LDEATSSVDTMTEEHIRDAVLSATRNRTSIIIAHRLSTVVDSDVILVMDGGRIVETGSHGELMAANGYYAELYRSQAGGSV
jgi:ATP-binding cassette subfamily B multidrug efflux pump